MKPNDLRALVALYLIPQIGSQRYKKLLRVVDQPAEVFTMGPSEMKRKANLGLSYARRIATFDQWDAVDELIRRTEDEGAELISVVDEDYPPMLKHIYDPPLLLWVKGSREALTKDGIAVVGTRSRTDYGRDQAKHFAAELVGVGLSVVSGLAYGIDADAHRAALENKGTTVAVLGSGIDWIYPNKNIPLAHDIISNGGAVITEFPLQTKPDAGNFPERNRIVSGMTLGTLMVESDLKGGSMITARLALDQNREVFVVPHSLDNPSGQGNNALIKRGQGKLVQTIDDIIQEISVQLDNVDTNGEPAKKNWESMELDEESESICTLLEQGPRHIDDLCEELEMSSGDLLVKMLDLEMKKCVEQQAGKHFRLI